MPFQRGPINTIVSIASTLRKFFWWNIPETELIENSTFLGCKSHTRNAKWSSVLIKHNLEQELIRDTDFNISAGSALCMLFIRALMGLIPAAGSLYAYITTWLNAFNQLSPHFRSELKWRLLCCIKVEYRTMSCTGANGLLLNALVPTVSIIETELWRTRGHFNTFYVM